MERMSNLVCDLLSLAFLAEPCSSVGNVYDLSTGGRWFDPRLRQYFSLRLMIVIATGLIPLSTLSAVAWKEYCVEYRLKELKEGTGRRGITEILYKMALNSIQSINLLFWDILPKKAGLEYNYLGVVPTGFIRRSEDQPLTRRQNLAMSKLKAFPDDNRYVIQHIKFDFNMVENILGKGRKCF